MKKFYLATAIAVITFNAPAQNNYRSAIVGFYNAENLYDTIFHGSHDDVSFTPKVRKAYTSTVFNDKIAKLATVIGQMGADMNPDGPALLGLAEVENKYVLEQLVKHPLIASRGYRYVHYDSKDFRGVDVALLYQPKYFKVEKSRPVFVSIPAGAKEFIYTRDVLWVKGRLDGESINLFVNHWPSRSGGQKRTEPARMASAMTVRKFIDSLLIMDPFCKIIVMGDFNDDPVSNSITKGLKARANPGADDLYNPWAGMYKNGQGSLAYRDAWSLFDQILITPSFLKKQQGFFYYRHYIFKADYMIENQGFYKGYPMRSYSGDIYRGGYSDHFPVYMVLLKKDGP